MIPTIIFIYFDTDKSSDILFNIFDGILFGILFGDRKSTRLNSSHANISYAVFCLKKKKIK